MQSAKFAELPFIQRGCHMRKLILATAAWGAMLTCAGLLAPSAANATTISIGLQESGVNGGVITTVATDSGSPGLASFAGGYGTFAINSIGGIGYPGLAQPALDTNSLNVSSSSGGILTVWVTQTGLTSPQGINSFLSSFTANALSGAVTSVVETTFVSASNILYGGTQLATATFTNLGTVVSVNNTPFLSGPFSETTEYVITTNGASNVNDTVDLSSVPEPASLALLGCGVFGLGMARKRRAQS